MSEFELINSIKKKLTEIINIEDEEIKNEKLKNLLDMIGESIDSIQQDNNIENKEDGIPYDKMEKEIINEKMKKIKNKL